MNLSTISIALTGSGGAGVMTAGQILVNAAAMAGYYGLMGRSLGPQVRGGEAAALLRLSSHPVETPGNYYDILFAFDWGNIERFAGELPLTESSLVICDDAVAEVPRIIQESGARIETVPLSTLANRLKDGRRNMVGIGILAKLIGLGPEFVEAALEKALARKGEDVLEAARSGVRLGAENGDDIRVEHTFRAVPREGGDRWTLTGNEAAGVGALRGGVRFVAAYPITPATDILEWMAPNMAELGGTLVQAEDELASVNMVLGASFGGVPSLTATSGPGLALMLESFGLGVASEVPFTVINVQRGGPSTGIPTKSEQADLNIALYGAHGDAPHLVLAPTSVSDCLFTTQWAVTLSETLQAPAIVLSEQAMGQTRVIVDPVENTIPTASRAIPDRESLKGDEKYLRYRNTESGVSPMALPGMPGGEYVADGLEHNEQGIPSTLAGDHLTQLEKRERKLSGHDYGEAWADIDGEGEVAVITFGSLCGVVREALARSRTPFRYIGVRLLSPPRPEEMKKALAGVKRLLVVELNHSGQFLKYLKSHYDLPEEVQGFQRPGPLPIRFNEIMSRLEAWR